MTDYKKPDHWQLKARQEGYPARSVYKLKEINEKFAIFKIRGGLRVLDIGAAPGSWSLFVLRKICTGGKGFLAAVDLGALSREFDGGLFDADNFFFVQGDVTDKNVRETLLSKGPYNAIISDVAPNTTGNHMIDSARSLELAEIVVDCAVEALAAGGNLAVKVFQGAGVDAILKRMKTIFTAAKSFKPQACRGESVETYFIGLGKKPNLT
ncbi:MAG: RlmE family RNA methyltransferase [Treponema sp.]|nr:RlmE family RNA methyltransferase [Treponema sp.]MCL2238286.1 RlmE family RNA methyltransferase [Treponema sp.]